MLSIPYQIEMLKNVKFQNQIISKKYDNIILNEYILKDIMTQINNIYDTINNIHEINNRNYYLIIVMIVLQLFILFK